jgi:hypothetical protein
MPALAANIAPAVLSWMLSMESVIEFLLFEQEQMASIFLEWRSLYPSIKVSGIMLS